MTNYIAMDIGNSQTSCGLFRNDKLSSVWQHKTSDTNEIIKQIDPTASVLVCSVVPEATNIITSQLRTHGISFKNMVLNEVILPGVYSGMGVDRFADAIAAREHYSNGAGVIVIDLGTATTLTAVSPNGNFAGGYITLGLGSTLSSLSQRTAQLPKLSVSDQTVSDGCLGITTQSAILDGSVLGHLGQIDAWIKSARMAIGQSALVVATGGWSSYLGKQRKFWDHLDPDLTLKGIFLINALDLKDPA